MSTFQGIKCEKSLEIYFILNEYNKIIQLELSWDRGKKEVSIKHCSLVEEDINGVEILRLKNPSYSYLDYHCFVSNHIERSIKK